LDFLATLMGAAVGVVAGTVIQYLVQIWVNRHSRKLNIKDLKIEAEYNLAIAEQTLTEVGKFRAAAQPATFANYKWFFRSKDMLSVALTRTINSGEFYRIFNRQEIVAIQELVQWFNAQFEQFIFDHIEKLKVNGDIPGAHQFANHLDMEIRRRIDTIKSLIAKF
jgi:hypothetical protein